MENNLNKIINLINEVQERNNKIKPHIESIISKLTFEIYFLNKDVDLLTLKIKYENKIQEMLNGCFGKAERPIRKDNDFSFWALAKLDTKLVAGLLIDHSVVPVIQKYTSNKNQMEGLWIWNVCRDISTQYKGYGIGEKTLKHALKFIKRNYPTYKKIYLVASQKPVSRTKYYESMGFKQIDYYENYDDNNNPIMEYNL